MKRLARTELAAARRIALGKELEAKAAGEHHDRLVLHAVILKRERFASFHVQDLADVPIRHRPNQLVAPGFVDDPRRCLGHSRGSTTYAHETICRCTAESLRPLLDDDLAIPAVSTRGSIRCGESTTTTSSCASANQASRRTAVSSSAANGEGISTTVATTADEGRQRDAVPTARTRFQVGRTYEARPTTTFCDRRRGR